MMFEERAYTKLNLTLEVAGRLTTGRHLLRSIVAPIELHDLVRVSVSERPGSVSVRTVLSAPLERHMSASFSEDALKKRLEELQGGDNLAARAAEGFRLASGLNEAIHIEIVKQIPLEAGLGGGSADAAAILRCLQAWRPLPEAALVALAATLGADVPICLSGQLSLMYGTGTQLLELGGLGCSALSGLGLLIVKPNCGVATASAYQSLGFSANLPAGMELENAPLGEEDLSNRLRSLQVFPVEKELRFKSLEKLTILDEVGSREPPFANEMAERMRSIVRNDFQPVVQRTHPAIAESIAALEESGASAVVLCGSGSAVCGFFPSLEKAQTAESQLRLCHDSLKSGAWFSAVTRILPGKNTVGL